MASLQFDAPLSDTGKALHQYAIPRNGGPFKGFAFVVVNDGEKARRAQDEWSWSSKGKRVITEEEEEIDKAEDKEDSVSEGSEITEEDTFDQEGSNFVEPEASTSAQALGSQQEQDVSHGVDAASSTPSRNPQQLARRSGLCVMPVERFNQLRLEYLRYSRDIAALKERHEALHDNSFSRRAQRRSASPNPSRNRRRSPSPEKWERKPRSPSPDRWERKPLSPQPNDRRTRRYDDTNDDDYPRGCVCFVKRFHPDARGGVLKTLFQAILELEEVCPKDYLQHVDHKRNVDSVSFVERHAASVLSRDVNVTFAVSCAVQRCCNSLLLRFVLFRQSKIQSCRSEFDRSQ